MAGDRAETIRIVHVTPAISRRGGGVAAYVAELVRHGLACGLEPAVISLDDQYVTQDTEDWDPRVTKRLGRIFGPAALGYSPQLRRHLRTLAPRSEVIHAHGLRMWPTVEARRAAERAGLPLILSTHGMLYPQLLGRGAWRKRLAGRLYDRRNLESASCLHATSSQEVEHIRAYGLDNPIAVVPIGLDTSRFLMRTEHRSACDQAVVRHWPELRGRRRLLFLGLPDPKKGLLRLAEAWGGLFKDVPEWHLVIAGPQTGGHAEAVRAAVEHLQISHRTTFTGPLYADLKHRLLCACDLFVLPTDWENFGIVVAEALASGVPVITTRTTPWEELERCGCGWWIDPGTEPLQRAMSQAMMLSDEQRLEMGRRGRDLIEREYAWPKLAQQMRQVYLWTLGRGDRPEFVM